MKKLTRILALLLVFTLVLSRGVQTKAQDKDNEYTVQQGDFLWKIAAEKLGDGKRFTEIYDLNKQWIKDIDLIYPGQKLVLPGGNKSAIPGSTAEAVGDVVNGFKVTSISDLPLINADVIMFEHIKTGALLMYIANDDTNRTYEITFRTPAINDSGIPHVFEHSTLDGSDKYPSKSLFFNLSYQTYNTYMNAATYPFMTTYPIASLSEAQLLKYADYYTDSCFNPMVCEDESIFREEAWRYVLPSADSELTIAGTVYSEMQGAYTLDSASNFNFMKTIFPGSTIGNVSGGNPDNIPDMTWENLCDYHDAYYHPSNSLTCLYGKFDDVDAFLKLINKYFSKYDKQEINLDDAGYTALTEDVVKRWEYAVEEGTDTEKSVTAYYGFVLGDLDAETLNKVDLLTTLISDDSSVFQQNMKKQLPYASAGCYVDFTGPEDMVEFYASGINEADVNVFRNIVDDSLKTISKKGFDMEVVDAIVASFEISILLSGESSSVGVNLIPSIAYYWAGTGNEFGYMDYLDSIDSFKKYAEDGTFKKMIKNMLLSDDTVTALSYTVPVVGAKEQKDAALADKLAAYKASLSTDEINALVAATKAYENEEEEDNTEYIRKLTAVTVESLPEEVRVYDYSDKIGSDGVRKLDVEANVDGVGQAIILFDAQGLKQDQIQYFKLYSNLLGSLDTQKYTVAELSSKTTRYLYGFSAVTSLMDDDKNGYHPYFRTGFIAMDDDLQPAYDLVYEIMYNTKFDDVEKLLGEVTAMKTNLKASINAESYAAQLYRAAGKTSEMYAYYSYMNYYEYYKFLSDVEAKLQSNPAEVVKNLQAIASYLNNRTNAISAFVGNSDSIKANRTVADKFFAKLKKTAITKQTYKFNAPADSEGIIIDSSVAFNALYTDIKGLGIDEITADIGVVASYVNDTYLYPIIRDKYGAYGVMHGAFETGIYIVSYRDPNVAETFNVYAQLPEMVKSLETVDQETLDGYILSSYSGYALSQGELTGGYNAAVNIISGKKQTDILDDMKAVKSITPEKAAEYSKLYAKLIENCIISTSGAASIINGNAAMYQNIINVFNSVDKTKVEFSDVTDKDSFYAAVRFVYENGFMDASGNDKFGAADNATLGEFAAACCAMLGMSMGEEDAVATLSAYGLIPAGNAADILTRDNITAYAETFCLGLGMPYPAALADAGYPAKGIKDGSKNASRADMAVIAYLIYTAE